MTKAITKPRTGLLERAFSPRADTSTLSRPAQWLIDALGGSNAASGATVSPKTAMGIATYFACIRNISEDLAKLPWDVYEKQTRGREKRTEHPVHRLIHDQPNESMGSMVFFETLTAHALGYTRGIAEIGRNGARVPTALYPLDPSTVCKEISSDGRRIRYRVSIPGFSDVYLSESDVLDIHGLGYDGLTGYAMTCIARDQLGVAISTQNYSGKWFGNGAQPSGIVEVPPNFAPKAMENLRESFKQRHEGEENKGRTMMLESGVTWKPVSVDAQKAMLIEAMEWQVEEICRRFRMPPQKVGHLKRAQGWSTVEQFNTDYVVDCLTPWARRWEQEIQRKLFTVRERDYYAKVDFRGLLRGDSAGRAAMYQALFNIGMISQNEGREWEDLEPIKGGDTYFVQGAMMPVDLLIEKLKADIEATKNPPEPTANPGQSEPKQATPAPENRLSTLMMLADAHEPLLADAFARVLRVEATKVEQARKRGNVESLRESFYADHEQHVIAAIGPVIEAFWVAATGKKPEMTRLREVAAQHVSLSTANMDNAFDVQFWNDGSRANDDAKHWLAQMVEQIAGASK